MRFLIVDSLAISLIIVTFSLGILGLRLHHESIKFDATHRDKLKLIKKKLWAKFRLKTFEMIKLMKTTDDDDLNTSTKEFPKKINELSKILTEIEDAKKNFKQIRILKKTVAHRFFLIAVVVGINALFLTLDFSEISDVTGASTIIISVFIIFGNMFVLFPINTIITSYKEYSQNEELFLNDLEDAENYNDNLTEPIFPKDNK